jgi:hypothetical protein
MGVLTCRTEKQPFQRFFYALLAGAARRETFKTKTVIRPPVGAQHFRVLVNEEATGEKD